MGKVYFLDYVDVFYLTDSLPLQEAKLLLMSLVFSVLCFWYNLVFFKLEILCLKESKF